MPSPPRDEPPRSQQDDAAGNSYIDELLAAAITPRGLSTGQAADLRDLLTYRPRLPMAQRRRLRRLRRLHLLRRRQVARDGAGPDG